jgi:hypothetical protein
VRKVFRSRPVLRRAGLRTTAHPAGSRALAVEPFVLARLASLRRSFPARITFHPRWLSRGFPSPQHMRRDRSPPWRGDLAAATPPCAPTPALRRASAPTGRASSVLGVWSPLRRLAPDRALRKAAKPSAALARFSLRSLSASGAVPVSRPLPSGGSLVAFRTPAAGPLQGLLPRTKFLEVLDQPSGAPLGFPFQAFSFAALAHGLFPGPSSCALPVPPPCGLRIPGALESCATANAACRFQLPACLGFSTSPGLATGRGHAVCFRSPEPQLPLAGTSVFSGSVALRVTPRANHPAYFGLAADYFDQPFQPSNVRPPLWLCSSCQLLRESQQRGYMHRNNP